MQMAALPDPPDLKNPLAFESLISDVSARLAAAPSETFDAAVEAAVGKVVRFFGADRGGILSVDAARRSVRLLYGWYADGLTERVPAEFNFAEHFPWGYHVVVETRQPMVVHSIDDLPPEAAVDRKTREAMGIRSGISLPITIGSDVRYIVAIDATHQEVQWQMSHVPRLQLVGEILANSIDVKARKRAEAEQRGDAARLAAAVTVASLGLYEVTDGNRVTFTDARCRELFGMSEEGAKGESGVTLWFSRVHPDHVPEFLDMHNRLNDGGLDRVTVEYRYLHPTQGVEWLQQVTHVFKRHESGRAAVTLGVVRDVTAEKRREESLAAAHVDLQRLRDQLERENAYLRQEAKQRLGPMQIIGRGPAIRRALSLAEQVGPTDSTVLLLGETGTGKERLAAYIHECSRRRERPMIRVNCSAIPTPLIESELFGREKGAYTGAHSRQIGRFELAHGSTLFLDEIGELPLEVQVKLLRVLENRAIERLGSPKPVMVDVRIIAATNRDLGAAVRDGRFREDLYYRLNVFPVVVPPLRDRREDIPLFVQAFIDEMAPAMGKRIEGIDPASLETLAAYAWPGNVRELRNVIERAMILASGPTLLIEGPPRQPGEIARGGHSVADGRDDLLKVLEETGWRVRGPQGAAARLGLKPSTLESRMKKLGVARPGKTAHS